MSLLCSVAEKEYPALQASLIRCLKYALQITLFSWKLQVEKNAINLEASQRGFKSKKILRFSRLHK
jgi:hypothetical protein